MSGIVLQDQTTAEKTRPANGPPLKLKNLSRLVIVFLARDVLKSGRDAKGKIDIDFFAVIVSGNL